MFSSLRSTLGTTCHTNTCLRSERDAVKTDLNWVFLSLGFSFFTCFTVTLLRHCSSDRWFPGSLVVSQHPLLSLLGVHPHPHADQPAHPVRLHGSLPHQPLQDLLLQVTILAPQTAGQCHRLLRSRSTELRIVSRFHRPDISRIT